MLYPTLLTACMHDTVNLRILSTRLSPAHLLRYLREHATPEAAAPHEAHATPPPAAARTPDPSELPVVSLDFSLAARLPPSLWAEANSFFAMRPDSPAPANGVPNGEDNSSGRGSRASVGSD